MKLRLSRNKQGEYMPDSTTETKRLGETTNTIDLTRAVPGVLDSHVQTFQMVRIDPPSDLEPKNISSSHI